MLVRACFAALLLHCSVTGVPVTEQAALTEPGMLVHQDVRVAVSCGTKGTTCSVNGVCTLNETLGDSFCKCDHGYRGVSCSERYFLTKTFEVTSGATQAGQRYVFHTEGLVVGMRGKQTDDVTLNVCLASCEAELDFACAAAVFVSPSGFLGTCYIMDQRHLTTTTHMCVSYSRGPEECYYGDGTSYRGTAALSATGHVCQRWDVQSPNLHTRTPENYPLSGLEENYCRNPDDETGLWCYTLDGDRWELCGIPACDTTTPTPTPTPTPACPEGCSLHGHCDTTTGICSCFPGWVEGPTRNCGTPASCLNDCSGHGQCELGLCRCDTGWDNGFGDCSQESVICPNSCSGHGDCDQTCSCAAGWTGLDCNTEVFVCPHNCSGNGYCNSLGECVCDPAFLGEDCTEPVCPESCSGHGTCDRTTRICTCDQGYTGVACDQVVQPKCENDCNGNGDCIGGRCFCHKGWQLSDCSKWEEPACPNNCSGHGNCEDGVCVCHKHYSGSTCETYTPPHYAPWPTAALIIPGFLAAAFFVWVFYLCHRVDVSDGKSDFADLPVIRMFFQKREKKFRIKEGQLPSSRVKTVYFE